jgi:hypothetical protein
MANFVRIERSVLRRAFGTSLVVGTLLTAVNHAERS